MKWTLAGASASKIKQYSNAQKVSRIFADHHSPVSDEYPIIIDESMSLKDLDTNFRPISSWMWSETYMNL